MRTLEVSKHFGLDRLVFGAAAAGFFLWSALATGATITVTSAADTTTVDGVVTLREAITSINNAGDLNADVTANRTGTYGTSDTINFNISGAGVHTITVGSALPNLTKTALIDGYSQTGASVNTLAVGDNAVLLIQLDGVTNAFTGLALQGPAGGTTIRGLVMTRFSPAIYVGLSIASNGNTIAGNFLGIDPTGTSSNSTQQQILVNFSSNNTIGGTAPAARNVVTSTGNNAIDLEGGSGNVVQGNYIGTNAAGTASVGAPFFGVRIDQNDTSAMIGGTASGAGNVIGSFGAAGISIGLNASVPLNTVIQGNRIGTNAAGTALLASGQNGILAEGGAPVTIGGSAAGAGNLISGAVTGIHPFNSVGAGWLIQGNKIGTDITGSSALGNLNCGILLDAGSGVIGGTNAGEGNIIAFNGTQGITVNTVGWAILGNSMTDNVGMGITLASGGGCNIAFQGAPGQTGLANDDCDPDTGPGNNRQNYPVITSAPIGGGNVTISGTLNSLSNRTFRLEFFSSTACDATGFGEGKTFLGSANVTTGTCAGNGTPNATFGPLVFPISGGQTVVTATATLLAVGSLVPVETSEFSACFALPVPTNTPTSTPTNTPTSTPTNTPTNTPTGVPTSTPTSTPTVTPTFTPSTTLTPTSTPTTTPTLAPSNTPTRTPTLNPSAAVVPTLSPSMLGLLALALAAAAIFLFRRA